MARTLSGRLTGRAASTELAELRACLAEEQERIAKLRARFYAAGDRLIELDPNGWMGWYDENIPDWNGWENSGTAVERMEKRVAELHNRTVLQNKENR